MELVRCLLSQLFLSCKDKRQYLLTLQVSRYYLLALQSSVFLSRDAPTLWVGIIGSLVRWPTQRSMCGASGQSTAIAPRRLCNDLSQWLVKSHSALWRRLWQLVCANNCRAPLRAVKQRIRCVHVAASMPSRASRADFCRVARSATPTRPWLPGVLANLAVCGHAWPPGNEKVTGRPPLDKHISHLKTGQSPAPNHCRFINLADPIKCHT